jgi:hypothetical protein
MPGMNNSLATKRDPIDQAAHDLLDDAQEVILGLATGELAATPKVSLVIARIRACADQLQQAGKDGRAKQLRAAANMIEQELAQHV